MVDRQLSAVYGGKLPPQATEVEDVILGSILIDKNAMLIVVEKVKPEMFYKSQNEKIYSACVTLFALNNPIDILTVKQQLTRNGELEMVGGSYYLTELTSRVASSANVESHVDIIVEKFIQREAIRICTDTITEAYDDTSNPKDTLEKNQAAIFDLISNKNANEIIDISKLAAQRIIALRQPEVTGLVGVGSGYLCLDELTNGWRNSDLIIIAARPAMGKTAFALQLARNAAIQFNVPTLIFSLEMSKNQLTDRLLSSETMIYQDDILKRRLNSYDLDRIETASKQLLQDNRIFIDDTASVGLLEMKAKARRLKQRYGIGLIVIDYLQLMSGLKEKNGNREQEISSISRGLKAIAKELDIPVIALSQLNRAVEAQPGNSKRPNLSHLRESGAIEQDADQVIFLYRPEYYGITTDESNNSIIGLTEIIFAKNRNGICETVNLEFNGGFMKFRDWRDKFLDNQNNIQPSDEF